MSERLEARTYVELRQREGGDWVAEVRWLIDGKLASAARAQTAAGALALARETFRNVWGGPVRKDLVS